ncbi:hypothetical protein B1R94_04360 [Mycolicibacterium litorale]|nr:hypothetical protein B1R94_04360 [Mycolicibacterium litorale]
MQSRIIPLEYLKERDVMFWLPPGGRGNDVWADTWIVIAELDVTDAGPVLELLQDNDIGGYVAKPSRRTGAAAPGRQLYVDREQYTRAGDLLMLFLRKKEPSALPAGATRKPPRAAPPVREAKPRGVRILVTAAKIAFVAALIGLGVLLAYYKGVEFTSNLRHTPPSPAQAPGLTAPGP